MREYEDDEAEPNTVSKYIEASSDKDFVLKWKFSHPFPAHYAVEMRVQVDVSGFSFGLDRLMSYIRRKDITSTVSATRRTDGGFDGIVASPR